MKNNYFQFGFKQTFFLIRKGIFQYIWTTFMFSMIYFLIAKILYLDAVITKIMNVFSTSMATVIYSFFLILFTLLVFFYFCVVIKLTHALENQQDSRVITSIRSAWKTFGVYLYTKLLFVVHVSLWTLVFVIPGIVVAVYYSLSSVVVLVEGKKGIVALRESKRLIKKRIMKYLDNLLIMFLLMFILCVPLIILLDGAITFFQLKGLNYFADSVDLLEVFLLGSAMNTLIVYVYTLYLKFRSIAGEV